MGCGASVPAETKPAPDAESMPMMGPAMDLRKAFACFDGDGNGTLELSELKRAFRAIGIKKLEITEEIFAGFDTNKDGHISLEEFDANLDARTRAKVEACLDPSAGFTFDAAKWAASKPAAEETPAEPEAAAPAEPEATAAEEAAPAAAE